MFYNLSKGGETMKVTKRITSFQLAGMLCKFIPELDLTEVTACLLQRYGYYANASSFHDWVRYFDGLVIDEKDGVICAKTSKGLFY